MKKCCVVRPATLIAALVLCCAGCGSAPPPAASAPPPTSAEPAPTPAPSAATPAPSAATPAPSAPPSTPGAKDAAKWVKDLEAHPVDKRQQAELAANGLSGAEFKLPADLRRALAAISGESIDPEQRTRVVVSMLQDTQDGARIVQTLCGSPAKDVLDNMAPANQPTPELIARCKLTGLVDDAPQQHFAPVLLSAVLMKLLIEAGEGAPAELQLARLVVYIDKR